MSRSLKVLICLFIHVYQSTISPLLGNCCRFYPTCSAYGKACLEKYPLLQALKKITCRILKCNPLHPGGIDLP